MEAIVAMDSKRGIGKDGGIPWDIPGDRALFKGLTIGRTVIMGRGTWESLPEQHRPLSNRLNVVVSTSQVRMPGTIKCHGIDLLKPFIEDETPSIVIGGGQLYAGLWDQINTVHVSHIEGDFDCDTFFPALTDFSPVPRSYQQYDGFRYTKYERIS